MVKTVERKGGEGLIITMVDGRKYSKEFRNWQETDSCREKAMHEPNFDPEQHGFTKQSTLFNQFITNVPGINYPSPIPVLNEAANDAAMSAEDASPVVWNYETKRLEKNGKPYVPPQQDYYGSGQRIEGNPMFMNAAQHASAEAANDAEMAEDFVQPTMNFTDRGIGQSQAQPVAAGNMSEEEEMAADTVPLPTMDFSNRRKKR